ncbi:MAG: DNA starvation/stationary phase protection protein [Bdellovibrionaceae bacterium]|nr:DNA starvation/stationary phase protection protein [Pseudobdellovibrionaceae bacterium]
MKSMKVNIGLSDKQRKDVAGGLGDLLADSYSLYLKTHNFHWNVEGPMFRSLHLMFMEQYTDMWNALDEIAERIRALGHYAPGTYADFMKRSTIKDPKGIPKAPKMVEELVAGHEAVILTLRMVCDLAEDVKDQPTLDLVTRRLEFHEKTAWMLRSVIKA